MSQQLAPPQQNELQLPQPQADLFQQQDSFPGQDLSYISPIKERPLKKARFNPEGKEEYKFESAFFAPIQQKHFAKPMSVEILKTKIGEDRASITQNKFPALKSRRVSTMEEYKFFHVANNQNIYDRGVAYILQFLKFSQALITLGYGLETLSKWDVKFYRHLMMQEKAAREKLRNFDAGSNLHEEGAREQLTENLRLCSQAREEWVSHENFLGQRRIGRTLQTMRDLQTHCKYLFDFIKKNPKIFNQIVAKVKLLQFKDMSVEDLEQSLRELFDAGQNLNDEMNWKIFGKHVRGLYVWEASEETPAATSVQLG